MKIIWQNYETFLNLKTLRMHICRAIETLKSNSIKFYAFDLLEVENTPRSLIGLLAPPFRQFIFFQLHILTLASPRLV